MTWDPADAVRVRTNIVTFEPSDGSDTIIFDERLRRWHRLPGTAKAIWMAIDGQRTVEQVTEVVAAAYKIDPTMIRRDVHALVSSLAELETLVHSPSV